MEKRRDQDFARWCTGRGLCRRSQTSALQRGLAHLAAPVRARLGSTKTPASALHAFRSQGAIWCLDHLSAINTELSLRSLLFSSDALLRYCLYPIDALDVAVRYHHIISAARCVRRDAHRSAAPASFPHHQSSARGLWPGCSHKFPLNLTLISTAVWAIFSCILPHSPTIAGQSQDLDARSYAASFVHSLAVCHKYGWHAEPIFPNSSGMPE